MSDEELRALERQARGGDLEALQGWARALARAGRDPAEAARVAAGLSSPLVEAPCWSGLGGDGVENRACDVEPLRATPRVAWRRDLEERRFAPHRRWRLTRARCLLGGWQGVVVLHRERPRVECLDPVTGDLRWSAPGASFEPRVVRDVLVARERKHYLELPRLQWTPPVPEGDVIARCLRTGEVLFARSALYEAGVGPGGFFTLTNPQHGRTAPNGQPYPDREAWTHAAHDWPDPRRPPAEARRWTAPLADWRSRARRLTPLRDLVLVETYQAGLVGLDRATGVKRWSAWAVDVRADELGLAGYSFEDRPFDRPDASPTRTRREAQDEARAASSWRVVDLRRGFVTRWRLPDGLVVVALGRTFLVVRPWRSRLEELFVLDRETGACLSVLERPARPSFVIAIARDVIYTARAQDGVEARTPRGELLWHVPWSTLGRGPRRWPAGLLPLDRRLVVAFDAGGVVCLA